MYLLNPYVNNFESALKASEIFKTFTKHLTKFKQPDPPRVRKTKIQGKVVTRRTVKRKRIVYNLPCKLDALPIYIFNKYFEYVMQGVITGQFIFKLPKNRGYIKNELSGSSVKHLRKYGLDPLIHSFKYYMPVIAYNKTVKYGYGKSVMIGLSPKYRELLNKANVDKVAHIAIKVVTPTEVAKILAKQLDCDVDYKIISSIIEHGFSYMANASYYKADTVVYIKNVNNEERVFEFFYLRNNKEDISEQFKFRRKLRVLRKMRKEKYEGYYYAALTQDELKLYKRKKPIRVRMYAIMEEAMLQPTIRGYIIKAKVLKPLYDKLIIEKEIKYAKANTKYIWRWNGERFESPDNS